MPDVVAIVDGLEIFRCYCTDNSKAFERANRYVQMNKMHWRNKNYQVYVETKIHRNATPVILENEDGDITLYDSLYHAQRVTGMEIKKIRKKNLIKDYI